MSRLAIGAAVALLVAIGAGGLYIKDLRADLLQTEERLQTAKANTAEREETIRILLEKERKNEKVRRQLAAERAGIQTTLEARETMIRNLENENADLRAWAAVPLPGPVVRLLEHGTIIGAAAYRQRMSEGGALQPAGGARHQ